MAKICPLTNEKVIYMYCQECENKKCRNISSDQRTDVSEKRKQLQLIEEVLSHDKFV